jgi:type I restriction enzyme S subunit
LFYQIIDEILKIQQETAVTTVKHLSSKDVLAIQIELPNIIEQTAIAAILSSVDQAIEQTEAIIAKQ